MTTGPSTFGQRLRAAIAARGRLCVGIDPHESLLLAWGLDADAAGVRQFGLRVVEAAAGRVGVVKPQVSFFERYGAAGFAALEDVLAAARAADLLVVADAKRGDIGTTMDAYAAAWLTPGAPLEADALTLSPYLGVGALHSTLRVALAHGKGAFVLAATSNPEAVRLQGARVDDTTVAASVAAEVAAYDADGFEDGWASLGLVVGATVDLQARGLTHPFGRTLPILAPGFGAQGAEPQDLARVFGPFADGVLASESRSILSAGPDRLAARIEERAGMYRGRRHA
ncbi:orotidine-5'-phosphate decarboxylase [Microbacterium telephonicum]|uniref:Orotidine-5'-phosphate decarboxylase n=1 Tax=Microbacterium telephonicum TaxID=1714841 RepID=A0A498BZP8_9MICO|nr:orotidine-5'-phosphate decarboxylase [Microbacterium telephonicum]RLK49204.1 orotidine-5'-phosphate decarboxylase [Microbacterium telephonicum]